MTERKKCPYCGSNMKVDPLNVRLPKKRRAIFDAVVAAGERGITEGQLDRDFYGGKGASTVRSAIHYINKAIFPLHIDGRNGYRLIKIEDLS